MSEKQTMNTGKTFFMSVKRILLLFSFLFQIVLSAQSILVPDQVPPLERKAADELRYFLNLVTGEEWRIARESEERNSAAGKKIFIGKTRLASALQLSEDDFGPEEWLIHSDGGGCLLICGGEPAGVLYGCYAFLEKLGVYFLTMDQNVVPRLEDFRFPVLHERKKPAFAGRFIFDYYPFHLKGIRADRALKAYWDFRLRSRMNGNPMEMTDAPYNGDLFRVSRQVREWHNFYGYLSPEKYFSTHPEYFSMGADGKRIRERFGGHLCLSNPEVREIVFQSLCRMIETDRRTLPEAQWPVVYDISQNDGGKSFCMCEQCQKIAKEEGSEAGLLLRFINSIADETAARYPGIRIRTFAYSMGEKVPRLTKPSPNVILFYCDLYHLSSCYLPMTPGQRRKITAWSDTGVKLMVWDYWNMGMRIFFDPPRPEVMVDAIPEDLRFFRSQKVKGLFLEAEKNFTTPQNFFDLQIFLAAQLMVDPEKNTDFLISLYLDHYYGKAAPMMKRYLDRLRSGVKQEKKPQTTFAMSRWNFLTPQFIAENYRLFQSAQRAVAGSPVHLARVREEMIPLLWDALYYRQSYEPVLIREGLNFETLKSELRSAVNETIAKYQPSETKHLRNDFEKRFAVLEADLPVPEKFRKESRKFVFGYPHQINPGKRYRCIVVTDPEACAGKALRTDHPDLTRKKKEAARFGFYDYATAKGKHILIKPADEKYHWYCIPGVEIGSRCIFWAAFWYLQIDLSRAYRLPDIGNTEVNCWDLWFRAKMTGPVFFRDSKLPDSVSVDQVVLVPPGQEK